MSMVTHWPQILQTPGIEDMLLAFFSRVLLRVKDDHFARADRFPTPPTSGSDSPSSSADSQPKVVTSRPDAWHPIPSPVAARAPTENSNVSENTSGHLREGCVKQRSSIIWPPFPPLRSPWNGNQSFQNTAPIPSRTGLNQTTGIGFQKGAARCFASGAANSLHLPPQTAKITGTGKCGGPHPDQVIQQHDDFVQNLPSHFWNNIWSTPNPQPPTLYPTLMPMPRTRSRFFPNPPPSQPFHTNTSISVSTQTTPPNDWSSRSFYSGPPVFETLWPKEKVSWKFMEPPRQKFQPQEKREADQKLQNLSQDMNMQDLEAVKDFLKLVRSLDVQFDLGGICRKMMDHNA